MSVTNTLLAELKRSGIVVALQGENLKVESENGPISEEVRELLKGKKQEIIRDLRETKGGIYAEADLEEAVSDYKREGCLKIYSTVLAEEIYLVRGSETAKQVPEKNLPVYRENEIPALKDLNPDDLKFLHNGKVIFGGVVQDEGNLFPSMAKYYKNLNRGLVESCQKN